MSAYNKRSAGQGGGWGIPEGCPRAHSAGAGRGREGKESIPASFPAAAESPPPSEPGNFLNGDFIFAFAAFAASGITGRAAGRERGVRGGKTRSESGP